MIPDIEKCLPVAIFKMAVTMSDTILKGTHPRSIPARFGLIWFSVFKGQDLNVTFYQTRYDYNLTIMKSPKPATDNQNCVRLPHPPFKMAAVTKNRNFFNCPLLL
jgi:hypothetical protein